MKERKKLIHVQERRGGETTAHMKIEKNGNFILGIAFLLFGIIYFIAASFVPESAVMDLGPDILPKVIAIITIILGGVQVVNGYRQMKAYQPSDESGENKKLEYWRVGATIVSFIIYVNLIEVVGFLIMTFIYLIMQMNILSVQEERKQVRFVIISLVTAVFVYFLFRNVFNVMIPAGILG